MKDNLNVVERAVIFAKRLDRYDAVPNSELSQENLSFIIHNRYLEMHMVLDTPWKAGKINRSEAELATNASMLWGVSQTLAAIPAESLPHESLVRLMGLVDNLTDGLNEDWAKKALAEVKSKQCNEQPF